MSNPVVQHSSSPQQHGKRSEIDIIGRYANKILNTSKQFREKYVPLYVKKLEQLQALVNELVVKPKHEYEQSNGQLEEEPQLSLHAQYLLNDSLTELKELLSEMANEHLQGHHTISMCNKKLDQLFHHDLSGLLRNQKELETDPELKKHVNRLIFGYLLSLGRVDVAETFKNESESSLDYPPGYNIDDVKNVMEPFRETKDCAPAIEWIKENKPEKEELLFKLQCQHIIQMLEKEGNSPQGKLKALTYSRELQKFSTKYQDEISHLMFVIMNYPNQGPYDYLFHDGRLFGLEEELAQAITNYCSPLATLLNAGIKTIPSLMTMRALLQSSRPGQTVILPDELPCNVHIPQQVHSTFCCPILKTQSTDKNPPVRLHCGHVISMDALDKLAQQSRNNRLKCPYCPMESNVQETVRLYF